MFINIPVIEFKSKLNEEFDDQKLELVQKVDFTENGTTTMYINTDQIESIIPESKTRAKLTLVVGGEIIVNKSFDEMGNLLQRVNTMHGFLPIPQGVF